MIGLVLLLAACSAPDGPPSGRWFAVDRPDDAIAQLEALGYASGTRDGRTGDDIWLRERAVPGTFFYASGQGPEAILRDLDGTELHRWHRSFRATWPLSFTRHGGTQNWRRATLLADGSVLAIHEGIGILKLDARSRRVWANANGAHHDLTVGADGRVVHLTRTAHLVPAMHATEPVLEDYVVWLDPNGTEQRRHSIVGAWLESPWAGWVAGRSGDVLHTNTVEILGPEAIGVHPEFVAGRLLLSHRNISALSVLDPETGALVWALRGGFRRQHDPTVTPDGRLLVFDNAGWGRERARVVEVDPDDGHVRWQWPTDPEQALRSDILGAISVLPGGHLVVTESEAGRAVEITEDGQIVWAWHSPHRAGSSGEYVAALFEVERHVGPSMREWADSLD